MVPLWDAELAAAEIRRCADKGSYAITFPENPVPARAPLASTTRTATGTPFFHGLRGDRDGPVHAHRLVVADAVAPSPDAPFIISSTLTFQNAMGSLRRLRLLRHPGRVSRPDARLLRGPGRLDALHLRAGRQAVGGARRQQLRHLAAQPAVDATSRVGSTAASSTTPPGCGTATSSAWTRSASRPTTPTPTRPSPHSKEVLTKICAAGRPRRRARSTSSPGATPSAPSASSASASPTDRRPPARCERRWRTTDVPITRAAASTPGRRLPAHHLRPERGGSTPASDTDTRAQGGPGTGRSGGGSPSRT